MSPHLVSEWSEVNENGPQDYTNSSAQVVAWDCDLGHTYWAPIYTRTRKKSNGCAICSGKQVLAGFNDLESCFPDVAKELHWYKNSGLQATEITKGTEQVVWWCCRVCDWDWQAKVSSRTRKRPAGCPLCANRIVVPGRNDLSTTHPELAAELPPELNDGRGPTDYSSGSLEVLNWQCPDYGHVYDATPRSRSVDRCGCPFCSGHRVLKGFNDLATTDPEVAATFHSDAGGKGRTPETVVRGSTARFRWSCLQHGLWEALVFSRSKYGTGCPTCSIGASKVELLLRDLVVGSPHFRNTTTVTSSKIPVAWRNWKSMRVDVVTESVSDGCPVAIEYDGVYYHESEHKTSIDLEKTQALLTAGYKVVRIRENGLTHLDLQHARLLQVDYTWHHHHKDLQGLVEQIGAWL